VAVPAMLPPPFRIGPFLLTAQALPPPTRCNSIQHHRRARLTIRQRTSAPFCPSVKPFQREFYAKTARIEGGSVPTLRARIDSMLYEPGRRHPPGTGNFPAGAAQQRRPIRASGCFESAVRWPRLRLRIWAQMIRPYSKLDKAAWWPGSSRADRCWGERSLCARKKNRHNAPHGTQS
jgi:hypothetical protein